MRSAAAIAGLSREELAYLAGIIDGEGSFMISLAHRSDCKGPVYVPCLSISNTSRKLVPWIRTRIGGSLSLSLRKRGERFRTCYNIQVYPSNLADLLPRIIPFLVVKREQAKTLSEFLETTRHGAAAYHLTKQERQARLLLYARLKSLNHPGAREDSHSNLLTVV
jgi:hypothetical protein